MNVQDMVSTWNVWGTQDPMFAILTDPAKAGGKWNQEEFFASGEKQVQERLKWLQNKGIRYPTGRALDFGCGIGRLTNALAKYFDEVHGVDISASMIERARELSRFPAKITYFQNTTSDLSVFKAGGYDFIYSEIVLQHIPPRYQLSYIEEFLRLLSPQGIAFFQTLHAVGWRSCVPNRAVELYRSWKHRGSAFIPMYGIAPRGIKRLIDAHRCTLLALDTFPPPESANRFWCDVYVIGKAGRA